MKVFLEVIKLSLKQELQYKWSFIISLAADPIVLLLNVSLFTSIYYYNQTNTILGYSLSQMIWYFAAATFVWYFIWNYTDSRMSDKILSGNLAIDLLKPISIFQYELANAIALRIMGVIFEFSPSLLLYSIIFYPDFLTVFSLLKFIAVVVMAFVLYFLINYLLGILSFTIKSNFSLRSIKSILISITAGAYIPLEFFPEWLRRIIDVLPFKYLFYWPIQFFLNREMVAGTHIFIKILANQLLWILILYLICKLLWRHAVKKFCAVGG